jgi:hypothetical protein
LKRSVPEKRRGSWGMTVIRDRSSGNGTVPMSCEQRAEEGIHVFIRIFPNPSHNLSQRKVTPNPNPIPNVNSNSNSKPSPKPSSIGLYSKSKPTP